MASRFPLLRITAGALAICAGVVLAGVILNLSSLRANDIGAEATPAASDQTAIPEPTVTPRDGWSTAFTIEPGPHTWLARVAEARGRLFALGVSDRTQPAIWFSQDGTTWTAALVPAMTARLPGSDSSDSDLTAIVADVVDAGERLVAVASVGLAEGSGPVGTMIYVSEDDGQTWTEVHDTPGITVAALARLARQGDRLIAVGTAIWSSIDGGLSWIEVADRSTIGGTLYAVDAHGDVFVAVGDAGDGDLIGPPALAMVSTDGQTWERTVIDPDAGALSVAIGPSGRIVVGGYRDPETPFWVSNDAGQTWEGERLSGVCCAEDLVTTPTGYIAASSASFHGLLVSTDGLTWTPSALEGGLDAVEWGPRFGLVGATEDSILLGPVPAP